MAALHSCVCPMMYVAWLVCISGRQWTVDAQRTALRMAADSDKPSQQTQQTATDRGAANSQRTTARQWKVP